MYSCPSSSVMFKFICLHSDRRTPALFNYFRKRNRRRSAFVPVEGLESRQVLSPVLVTSTRGPGGSVSLKFTGSDGNDVVNISSDENQKVHVSGSSFILNGGTAQTDLRFEKLHNVTFNLGAGSDAGQITDVSLNNIRINDGISALEADAFIIQSTAKDVAIRNVDAAFSLGYPMIRFLSERQIAVNDVSLRYANTTVSDSQFIAVSTGSITINGHLNIESANVSTDHVLFQSVVSIGSSRISIRGGTRMNLGDEKDDVFYSGTVDSYGVTLISTGDSNDFVLTNGEIVFHGRVSIDTGNGNDIVRFSPIYFEVPYQTRFLGVFSLSTGPQMDQVEFSKVTFSSLASVDLGSSQGFRDGDGLQINEVTALGKFDVRAVDTAEVRINGFLEFGFRAGTSRFAGTVRISIGSGTILIGSTQSNPSAIFDGSQIFIGTRSKITVKYLGPVAANFARRRLINAVVQ